MHANCATWEARSAHLGCNDVAKLGFLAGFSFGGSIYHCNWHLHFASVAQAGLKGGKSPFPREWQGWAVASAGAGEHNTSKKS